MPESTPQSVDQPRKTDFELATAVSRHVQLRLVVLRHLAAGLNVDVNQAVKAIVDAKGALAAKISVKHVATITDEEKTLTVTVEFEFKFSDAKDSAVVAHVDPTFELVYSLSATPPADAQNVLFRAFAKVNGVYHAWPYVREVVQNTLARMGLPPIVLPVFSPDDGLSRQGPQRDP